METPLIEKISRVWIDESARDSELTKRAFAFFRDKPISFISERPYAKHKGHMNATEFDRSKREVYLTEFKGAFFKRCPGAKPGLACCNYFVLNLGLQCNMNCSYCYLQSYLNTPVLTIFTNIDRALNELEQLARMYPDRAYRLGTGETTDSLSLDDFTLYSRKLIPFFAKLTNWTLEFKSKSAKVDQFLDIEHTGNVITSWSINPDPIINQEEHETASLGQRLTAARKCRDRGYKITFHIDPMIWHPEWKQNYAHLVSEITQHFAPQDIPYITVGALRYPPEQRLMMKERFGLDSWAVRGEMFLSSTGKLRYDNHVRSDMFQFLKEQFQTHSNKWRLSLCMETPESWSTTMATSPRQIPELSALFEPPQQRKSLGSKPAPKLSS